MINGLALCDYKECEKSCNCKRYEEKAEEIQEYRMEYAQVCNQRTHYKYFSPKEESIIKTEDKKEVKDETEKETTV